MTLGMTTKAKFVFSAQWVRIPARARHWLWDNHYPILAVLFAGAIRLVPVLASWPYAVGWDTTALYIPAMIRGPPDLHTVFTYPGLHFLILYAAYKIYPQPFIILDGIGVLLQAGLAVSFYVYARRIIPLDKRLSFLTSVAFTLAPITLRLTWDQYRMSLCLIAIMFAFVLLETGSNIKRSAVIPLTIFVILVNPLPAVLLLLSMAAHGLIKYWRGESFRLELMASLVGVVLFGLQQVSITQAGGVSSTIPLQILSPSTGLAELMYGLGFLAFTSWPLMIFMPFGLKFRDSKHYVLWFYFMMLFAVAVLFLGVYTIPTPFIYLMASFPLVAIVGRALKNHQTSRIVNALFAAALIFLVANSIPYLISSPLSPTGYASIGGSFRYYEPMGYLQSTVPVSFEKDLIQLLSRVIISLPRESTLYLPRQFYGLALLPPNPYGLTIVDIGEVNPLAPPFPFSMIAMSNQSYTVWFSSQTGWYGVYSIPSYFRLDQAEGAFALYQVAP